MKRRFKISLMAISLAAAACATEPNSYSAAPSAAAAQSDMTQIESQDKRGSVAVNQIGNGNNSLGTSQIASQSQDKGLTVQQLKVYADRCLPGSSAPGADGIDCSEIKLRMQRVFETDDKVIEALVTLNRLGRNDKLSSDVGLDLTYGSSDAQAIASGIYDTPEALPQEPDISFEEFLEQNGLSISAGAIIQGS